MHREVGPLGEIITFYSYKGGTGRTMALANIGHLLAQKHGSVLLVDWDLEAPGLHRYFRDLVRGRFPNDAAGDELEQWPGLIDFFREIERRIAEGAESHTEQAAQGLLAQVPIDRYLLSTDQPALYLLKAGRLDETYSVSVNTFDWEALHERSPWLLRAFAQHLAERFRYVLIDSRTGVTDTSNVCTSIMPGILVLVFTPNRQSLLGALEMAAQAARYRKDSDDLRPLTILPLASRIDAAEPLLRDLWRFGDTEQGIPGYQATFEKLFRAIYDLPECDLGDYFSEIQLQHVPRYAYGEQIAVRMESGDRLSLTRSFECFVNRMRSGALPWEQPEQEVVSGASSPNLAEPWLEQQRALAHPRLKEVDASGYMEASFFLTRQTEAIDQKLLLQAARSAQVPGTGWPIGAVVETSPQSRPFPTENGIAAQIIDTSAHSYDFWALRNDGAFYFVRNLEEDPDYLLADDRVERITELLLFCRRLYSFLKVDPAWRVRILVSFTGLAGRELGARKSNQPDSLYKIAGIAAQDAVQAEVTTEVGKIQDMLPALVKELSRPLFLMFNFYELPHAEYDRILSGRLREWGFTRIS